MAHTTPRRDPGPASQLPPPADPKLTHRTGKSPTADPAGRPGRQDEAAAAGRHAAPPLLDGEGPGMARPLAALSAAGIWCVPAELVSSRSGTLAGTAVITAIIICAAPNHHRPADPDVPAAPRVQRAAARRQPAPRPAECRQGAPLIFALSLACFAPCTVRSLLPRASNRALFTFHSLSKSSPHASASILHRPSPIQLTEDPSTPIHPPSPPPSSSPR